MNLWTIIKSKSILLLLLFIKSFAINETSYQDYSALDAYFKRSLNKHMPWKRLNHTIIPSQESAIHAPIIAILCWRRTHLPNRQYPV